MFALGCIQALKCNKNTCPTGITTHNKRLQRGLVPEDKAERVRHYAQTMQHEVEIIAHSCGVTEPRKLKRFHCRTVTSDGRSVPLSQIYPDIPACGPGARKQPAKDSRMKASDLFVKCLEEEGIEYIFGVPGEENADFMMSLEKSSLITFVLTRHEQGAAFMAEIYGRLTGNPAGCLGTLGPGATNLITGVADSNMDRAPMLVITGQGSTARLHKESHQIMDVVAMFRPVTKWATTILNPGTIPEIVRKAVRLARTEKPGAVHMELPEDVAKMETSSTPMVPRRFRRSVPDDKIVDQAFDMLKKAERPIILAGNGCVRKRASEQFAHFLRCDRDRCGQYVYGERVPSIWTLTTASTR